MSIYIITKYSRKLNDNHDNHSDSKNVCSFCWNSFKRTPQKNLFPCVRFFCSEKVLIFFTNYNIGGKKEVVSPCTKISFKIQYGFQVMQNLKLNKSLLKGIKHMELEYTDWTKEAVLKLIIS